ncbi:hypothetical protein VMCG_01853 [Cytospora schulzeri]|uniref:C2H2-type domain-containing protein n=1 Tax=Cytospora schulzeri TaxID=448051 RepID=A0A423X2U8_9PEZI|nr:hypothetical protein VMCG_01853 [Valsa malicola]
MDNNLPFFRLTDEELAMFRRKQRKGPTYVGFSNFSIAQELNRLGRGWKGYVRAKCEAEEEGRVEELWRRFQAERRLITKGLPLPVGAISMEAAAGAAEGSSMTASRSNEQLIGHDRDKANGPKEMGMAAVEPRPVMATDLRKGLVVQEDQVDERPNEHAPGNRIPLPMPQSSEPDPTEPDIVPSDATDQHQPPELTATSKTDSQHLHRGRPRGSKNDKAASSSLIDRPRPRRVETRPDYRIRRIRERHSELPPKPPSPTPRTFYDHTQPRFLQFKCEWTGCKAVLNNVANLRKHVGIVHGQEARDTLCCSWGKCGRDDSTGVLSIFASIDDLDVHLRTLHLESVKWHLGDGRLGKGLVVKDSGMGDTSYLYSSGKQVTPSITNQRTETLAELRARKERLREILLKTALNAPSDSECVDSDEDTQDFVLL